MSIATNKIAKTQYEIISLLKQRWSPRAFADKPVEKEKLQKIFEAARWSASCFNEQPWRFIVGIKGDGDSYQKVFDCFNENNQKWIVEAPVLFFICAKKTFTHSGHKNDWAEYDAGQAAACLTVEAMSENIYVHQMAGILKDKIIETFNIPDDFTPVTGFAIGYLGSPDSLPDALKEKELAERSRKTLNTIIFSDSWDNISPII